MTRRLLVGIVALILGGSLLQARRSAQIPPFGAPGEYVADLASRREQVRAALGPDTVLVLWSAPTRVFSTDVNYEYRQESNLLYLTGLSEPETVLVLVPSGRSVREVIFTRQSDPERELWEGHILTASEVTDRSGVRQVFPQRGTVALEAFLAALFGGTDFPAPMASLNGEFSAFAETVRSGRARLAILDDPREDSNPRLPASPDSRAAWATSFSRRFTGSTVISASRLLTTQRQLKSPYEQKVLTRSVEISAQAHVEGMKAARPGRWEYEVEAAIEYWFHKNGMLSWGYPSIVGSGPNATTLHYLDSTRQMRDGDLLLVDAAGNFQGLTGDITRTYPVNGRFTREQRALYDLVLRAEEAGIAAARPGVHPNVVNTAIRAVFAEGLVKLGLVIADQPGVSVEEQVGYWFPHGPVHGIGVDVHDPLGMLQPGAAFVIEPGLYIRPDTLDLLPATPEHVALAAKLRAAVRAYENIGIRIEDSFLMSPSGPVNLSAGAPRLVADLERVIGTGP